MSGSLLGRGIVRAGLDGMWAHVARERLRLYRLELQMTVTSVPVLLDDIVTDAGCELEAIVHGLPVPHGWNGGIGIYPSNVVAEARIFSAFVGCVKGAASREPAALVGQRVARRGALLRPFAAGGGGLVVTVAHGRLGLVADLGDALLSVVGPRGALCLPRALPETVAAVMAGGSLSRVVSHPVLDMRTYVVGAAEAGPQGFGTVLSFEVPTTPFEMPWSVELASALGAGS